MRGHECFGQSRSLSEANESIRAPTPAGEAFNMRSWMFKTFMLAIFNQDNYILRNSSSLYIIIAGQKRAIHYYEEMTGASLTESSSTLSTSL